jgi:tetratricopeptide (TPR) repeat protein
MNGFAASTKAGEGTLLANYGYCAGARAAATAAIGEVPEGPIRISAALALAQCGDTAGAQKLIDAEAKARPLDTGIHDVAVPLVQALNGIQRGDGGSAVASLEPGRRFEQAGVPGGNPSYWVLYVRGRAYLQLKDADKAVAEFQKILSFPGRFPESELIPLARLHLARAYALQKDTAKSKIAYQDFLALWKDADPDIPILQQAKAEYAKLQ